MSDADRVARHVEALLQGRRPARFPPDAEERRALRAAALLAAAARPEPDPAFLRRMEARLERELGSRRSPRISRRSLLAGAGALVAASGAGWLAARSLPASAPEAAARLEADGAHWQPAVAIDELPEGIPTPYATTAIQLLLVREGDRVRALSGTCTHLGCRLRPAADAIACPCHRTTFALDGHVLAHELPAAPPRLPEVPARVVAGRVELFMV